ncbi:ZP domain-containing protein [Aphelenchoides fujianensis]|nr:ZP domain-containing protein [Aphelenchoides fujianensis]
MLRRAAVERLLLLSAFLFVPTLQIPIPNGQIGKIEVECGEDTIEAVFLTEDVFLGRVFVPGFANDTNCVSRETGRRTTSITIRKDQCGVTTTRSANPPGLFVTFKILISFHDEFITKIDRGYEVSCFCECSISWRRTKTVTYPLTVSANSLQPLTELAEMPRCRYEVVDPFTEAKLLHEWKCDSTAPNLWCMVVHSCFIEDGAGTEIVILNDDGCAIDRYLLDNLEYGPGPLQAQKEAHAIKFADKVVVNFQCSIRLDIKDGNECPASGRPSIHSLFSLQLPKCPDLTNQKPRLNKRSHHELPGASDSVEVDVRSPQIQIQFWTPSSASRWAPEQRRSPDFKWKAAGRAACPWDQLLIPAGLCLSTILSMSFVIVFLMRNGRQWK